MMGGGVMEAIKNNGLKMLLAAAVAATVFGCNNKLTENAAPVQLIVTNTQNLTRLDLAGDVAGSTACQQDIGTIEMRALVKDAGSSADQRFNDVRVTRYRVSYVRTDGGTQVPAPFVRAIDSFLPASGSATALTKFLVIEPAALDQAPFAALRPNNGGRDPETGRQTIKMDVIIEIFGQTVAGENVSGSTRFSLDFCYQTCKGCA